MTAGRELRIIRGMDTTPREKVTGPEGDANLIRAAAQGDEDAMERLLLRAQGFAKRYSLLVCGRTDETEDVAQEALVSTYRHAGAIRDPAAFRTWLFRTVRNACLLSRRKRVDEPAHMLSLDARDGDDRPSVAEPAASTPTPESLLDAESQRAQLRQALLRLPDTQREILVLRDLEGLSTREVAEIVGISEDNVKQRLHRGRLALRELIQGR